jgi:hypothetical protein
LVACPLDRLPDRKQLPSRILPPWLSFYQPRCRPLILVPSLLSLAISHQNQNVRDHALRILESFGQPDHGFFKTWRMEVRKKMSDEQRQLLKTRSRQVEENEWLYHLNTDSP